MAYGNDGFLAVSKQESWGTASSSYYYVPIISEGMAHNKEMITQESILARYDEAAPIEGMESADGTIEMEMNPLDQGPFLLAACGSVTVTEPLSGMVFLHDFTLTQDRFDDNAALVPYTIQVYRGVEQSFQFTDGQVNTLDINITANAIVKMSVGMICRTTSLMTKSTESYHGAEENAFTWDQASISLAGTAIDDFESLSVSINNALSGVSLLDGTKRRGRIHRDGQREIRVAGSIDVPNLDEYDAFAAQTERALVITVTGADEISSGYYEYLKIDIPKFRYETYPINIAGPGRISVGFTGRAVYHTGSASAMEIFLQNSISAY